nr:TPA_inf: NADH dehydrogenase subunit 3 [Antarctophthirus carlinii]DAZ89637.1 TPA_inf: NADH dehydrogenase subunit 3 [Antarctophthirus lobodontis]
MLLASTLSSLLIVSVVVVTTLLLTYYNHDTPWTQNEPYECGLDQINPNRVPFSIYFYCLGVLYFIFDIEVVVSLPMIFMVCDYLTWLVYWFLYFNLMLVGLFLESMVGSLDWAR